MLRAVLRCRKRSRSAALTARPHARLQSSRKPPQVSKPLEGKEIRKVLAEPSWSVKSLLEQKDEQNPAQPVTRKQLHHLLRLSALPMPKSAVEESRMIATLESQLQFVRAIQSVDTKGIAPLAAIADETAAAKEEETITIDSLKDDLEREEQVGVLRRVVRRKATESIATADKNADDIPDAWDPLEAAPSTKGRYICLPGQSSGVA